MVAAGQTAKLSAHAGKIKRNCCSADFAEATGALDAPVETALVARSPDRWHRLGIPSHEYAHQAHGLAGPNCPPAELTAPYCPFAAGTIRRREYPPVVHCSWYPAAWNAMICDVSKQRSAQNVFRATIQEMLVTYQKTAVHSTEEVAG